MYYFEIYKISLKVINEFNPDNFQSFINESSKLQAVSDLRATASSDEELIKDFQDVVTNLMSDGLVRGDVIPTKSGNIFLIEGLTTLGHQFLNNLEQDTFWNKLKSVAKEEGIPTTPTAITRTISKLLF